MTIMKEHLLLQLLMIQRKGKVMTSLSSFGKGVLKLLLVSEVNSFSLGIAREVIRRQHKISRITLVRNA